MIEIKFRCWDKKKEQFVDDIYLHTSGWHFQQSIDNYNENIIFQFYTGLKDKNGKEIYEGDIVVMPFYGITTIVWNDNICSFQYSYHAIDDKGVTNTLFKHVSGEKYEVIGNIYENQELMPNDMKADKKNK